MFKEMTDYHCRLGDDIRKTERGKAKQHEIKKVQGQMMKNIHLEHRPISSPKVCGKLEKVDVIVPYVCCDYH